MPDESYASIPELPPLARQATFAGGCFWCMQPPFDACPGVIHTLVGYCGGSVERPSYQAVCSGSTGHLESILVQYSPQEVSYTELLDIFWRSIDPTQADGQFADRGSHYHSAIFVGNEEERAIAEASRDSLQASGIFRDPITTRIVDAAPFYPAETYHQNYYRNNSLHYNAYKEGSGRGPFLRRVWEEQA
ncbi:MAG: peptide-methionine (S)-S-oxide reductase [Planctomycetota bacterium]|nr:MAG: peptide-methionine (S)-S-oxide reductase [Planctomycetota bacterium]